MLFVSINHANPWGMEIKVNCESGQGNKRGGGDEDRREGGRKESEDWRGSEKGIEGDMRTPTIPS